MCLSVYSYHIPIHMDSHSLCHQYDQSKYAGRHAYSRTGASGDWRFSKDVAYTSKVQYEDGSSKTFHRRERPHLFLNDAGEPAVLYTGVERQQGGSKHTITLAQRIAAE